MNIQNVTSKISIQTRSEQALKSLMAVIPDTKIAKNLTRLDVDSFKTYVTAKSFTLKTTSDEIKNLFSYEGEEFFSKTWEFFIEKLGFKENLLPKLAISSQDSLTPFVYELGTNTIFRAADLSKYNKNQVFQCLRHEFRHYEQNMLVLRDDELGPNLSKFYAKKLTEKEQDFVFNMFTEPNLESSIFEFQLTPAQALFYLQCACCIQNEDLDEFIELFKPIEEEYNYVLSGFREQLLAEYGPLSDSEKQISKKYFKDFSNINYYNKDGSLDIAKHSLLGIEQEANLASRYALHEAQGGGCYFKKTKEYSIAFFKNHNEQMNILKEAFCEILQKNCK